MYSWFLGKGPVLITHCATAHTNITQGLPLAANTLKPHKSSRTHFRAMFRCTLLVLGETMIVLFLANSCSPHRTTGILFLPSDWTGGARALPGTTDGMTHVCYFRHALALDERRVMFQPEYGLIGPAPRNDITTAHGSHPQVLEVWFPGTHSDM
jgi:hypothetical protein